MKKTLILGASDNPERYAFIATEYLADRGIETVLVGAKPGTALGLDIHTGTPDIADVDTVTLYLNPQRQVAYYDYILGLKPNRIIFNPGTENPELMLRARENGIEPLVACTLVMLSVGTY